MPRFLVTLQSHTAGATDVLCVDVRAKSWLHALKKAIDATNAMGPWALMTAKPWPRSAKNVEEAALRQAASG